MSFLFDYSIENAGATGVSIRGMLGYQDGEEACLPAKLAGGAVEAASGTPSPLISSQKTIYT